MATNGNNSSLSHTTTNVQRRFGITISSITVRLLIAFAISWLILLIFFASGAVSR